MNLMDFANKVRNAEAEHDVFMRGCVDELSGRFLAKVRKRTPVGEGRYEMADGKPVKVRTGGELRRAWNTKSAQKTGKRYRAIVRNHLKYASYVEYGHRQHVGQFVPVLGKRLVNSWVPGQHMMQISHNEVNRQAGAIIQRRFRKFLKGKLK